METIKKKLQIFLIFEINKFMVKHGIIISYTKYIKSSYFF